MDKAIFDLINAAAKEHGIDPNLVLAVVMTESNGDPWVTRFEPAYNYLVNPRDWADKLGISMATEENNQRTSWGLMQPMGGVCREHGFGDHLTKLISPELSLKYGCTHLKRMSERYGAGDREQLYSAYNGGSVRRTVGGLFFNQRNVDAFARNLRALERLT